MEELHRGDIREHFEAFVWRPAVKQEHASDVGHPLHIADVRAHMTVGNQEFPQACGQRRYLLEQIVQVWKCPWYVSINQMLSFTRVLLRTER